MFELDFGEEADIKSPINASVESARVPFPGEHSTTHLTEELGCEVIDVVLSEMLSLLYLKLPQSLLEKSGVSFAQQLVKTDIISGVYEGGFKLWSCSIDLVKYLLSMNNNSNNSNSNNNNNNACSSSGYVKNKRVLEAGCGHGLPGIFALLFGAEFVCFQDYNADVLKLLTIPNVLLNLQHNDIIDGSASASSSSSSSSSSASVSNSSSKVEFWSGEWSRLVSHPPADSPFASIETKPFDLVLASDTLYTRSAAASLHCLLCNVLAPNGVALIASKQVYFGCGGGILALQEIIEKKQVLQLRVVAEFKDSTDIHRAIVAVERRNNKK